MSNPYGGGYYPPMPGEPPRRPAVAGPAPATVVNAVRLMFVRSGPGVIGVIVAILTRATLKRDILRRNPTADPVRLNSLLNVAIITAVVIGIIYLVLYVLLALQVQKGKNWARIVTFVFAGLGVLGGLLTFAQTAPALSHLISVLAAVIDAAVIVFLALGPSNQYFSATY